MRINRIFFVFHLLLKIPFWKTLFHLKLNSWVHYSAHSLIYSAQLLTYSAQTHFYSAQSEFYSADLKLNRKKYYILSFWVYRGYCKCVIKFHLTCPARLVTDLYQTNKNMASKSFRGRSLLVVFIRILPTGKQSA